MALLHHARLTPSKRELLDSWLPGRPWYDGTVERGPVGSFRLDDPEGLVGLEGFLLGSAAGSALFVPLSYRPAPLAGAEAHLVGTTEHSVLGTRWVYDGCADPAWAQALATVVLTGGTQAEERFENDGVPEVRDPSVTVRGTGSAGADVPTVGDVTCRDEGPTTVITAGSLELTVVRVLGTGAGPAAGPELLASWAGGRDVVLAGLRPRGLG